MPARTASQHPGIAAPPASEFTREVEERFIRYARMDTQSDEKSTTSPSTEKQYDLLRLLVDELTSIGAKDVTLTKYGAALATIPATTNVDAPTVALLAHVDTGAEFSRTKAHRNVRGHHGRGQLGPGDNAAVVTSRN